MKRLTNVKEIKIEVRYFMALCEDDSIWVKRIYANSYDEEWECINKPNPNKESQK